MNNNCQHTDAEWLALQEQLDLLQQQLYNAKILIEHTHETLRKAEWVIANYLLECRA